MLENIWPANPDSWGSLKVDFRSCDYDCSLVSVLWPVDLWPDIEHDDQSGLTPWKTQRLSVSIPSDNCEVRYRNMSTINTYEALRSITKGGVWSALSDS